MTNRRRAEWLVTLFFVVLVAIVFQQILTDMTESGIASGGPYDNAAAYPRAVAVIIGILSVILLVMQFATGRRESGKPKKETSAGAPPDRASLKRAFLLLVIFAVYLWALGVLGYYIATPLMMMGIVFLTGMRKPGQVISISLIVTFILSFVFEFFLKIVLPGGVFRLNIPW